jgi:uncharacterized protein YkwD
MDKVKDKRMGCLATAGFAAFLSGCFGLETTPTQPSQPLIYRSLAMAGESVDAREAALMFTAHRRNKGLGPLEVDPILQAVALREARAMAAADRANPSREALEEQVRQAGYRHAAANFSAGYHTLSDAFSGWRGSPHHEATLTHPRATRMGIATAYTPGTKYKVFWALIVADR